MVKGSKQRQREYTQRRIDKGDKHVSSWTTPETAKQIKEIQVKTKWSREIVIHHAIKLLHYAMVTRKAKWTNIMRTIRKWEKQKKYEKEKLLNK